MPIFTTPICKTPIFRTRAIVGLLARIPSLRVAPFAIAALLLMTATAVHAADPVTMVPHPWQLGMQQPHSPVQERIEVLNQWVTILIVVITAFVAGLLAYVLVRYNNRRHPNPGSFSHNTTVEILWTVLPVLILAALVIPSLRLVYYEDRTHDADLTIKVTGHQWYWEYTYPDTASASGAGLHYDSYMVADSDLKPGQLRHLAVDNQLVLPTGKNIRILETSADVIHSFFIPSLGVQRYAIPGRTIETWVRVDQPGDFYGECNQICGTGHSVMPISVHAVSPDDFKTWLDQAKTKFSNAGLIGNTHLALASEH